MDRIILGACGVGLWFLGEYLKKKNNQSTAIFSQPVEAKVVDFKEYGPYDRGNSTYYPTLEYSFNGKTYRTDDREGVSTEVQIGDVFCIFIDPKNPTSVCLVKGGETIFSVAAKVFGGFCIFSALLLFII